MLICYTFQIESGRGWIRKRGQRAEIICNFDDLHKCTLMLLKYGLKCKLPWSLVNFHYYTMWRLFDIPSQDSDSVSSETLVTIKGRGPLVNLNHFICTMHNACNLILKHTSSLLKSSCSFFWKALSQQKKSNSDRILS